MNKGLYYYKLQSPYPEDITKNCKLTINEIDNNFLSLKDEDIKNAVFDKESKTIILTMNDSETFVVDLSDATYDLNVEKDCTDNGVTITITYDGKEGKETFTLENIVTVDTLKKAIENDVLTKVITDGTLIGNGTISNPLGLNGTEKTGVLAPVKDIIDTTKGNKIPTEARKGTRYLTIENFNDYGYLYNASALAKITEKANEEGKGWRVPTKADWDKMLNGIEPCTYQNHDSASCHTELGRFAGKYLKSECGWAGQGECTCSSTKPMNGCEYPDTDGLYDGAEDGTPSQATVLPIGIDKYGFGILPSGYASLDGYNRPDFRGFRSTAIYWTSSHIYGDENQDIYVKEFDWNKSGVMQEAQCPTPYYSVRLVKDYDGENYFDTEYIDGVAYKTVLMPKSKQVWLASNYAKKEGFVGYTEGGSTPEYVNVNNGEVRETRKVMYINEWNGEYWSKRPVNEGETVVIENACQSSGSTDTKTICWLNENGDRECVDVDIPNVAQNNVSYKVYTTENCDQVLVNADDLAVERILTTIIPIIENERKERLEKEKELEQAIADEAKKREDGDKALEDRIALEEENRKNADVKLWEGINQEILDRISGDTELSEKIEEEKTARENADKELSDRIDNLSGETAEAIDELNKRIDQEVSDREAGDAELETKLNGEVERAKEAEKALDDKIAAEQERAELAEKTITDALNDEISRAEAKETEIENQLVDTSKSPFTMSVASGKNQTSLTLPSKDNLDEHSIKIMLDCNFGEI